MPAERLSDDTWIVDWNPYTMIGMQEREYICLRWKNGSSVCSLDLEGEIASQKRNGFGRVFEIGFKMTGGRSIFIKFRNP